MVLEEVGELVIQEDSVVKVVRDLKADSTSLVAVALDKGIGRVAMWVVLMAGLELVRGECYGMESVGVGCTRDRGLVITLGIVNRDLRDLYKQISVHARGGEQERLYLATPPD
jgi:hypothetical protein